MELARQQHPIAGEVLDELALTDEQAAMVRERRDELVRERARSGGPAKLTSPMNIGVGTKLPVLGGGPGETGFSRGRA